MKKVEGIHIQGIGNKLRILSFGMMNVFLKVRKNIFPKGKIIQEIIKIGSSVFSTVKLQSIFKFIILLPWTYFRDFSSWSLTLIYNYINSYIYVVCAWREKSWWLDVWTACHVKWKFNFHSMIFLLLYNNFFSQ